MRLASAAVLLLALLPAAVEASCGRHVSYPGDTADDRRPPAPCRGPSCSANPEQQPGIPPVTAPPADHDATLDARHLDRRPSRPLAMGEDRCRAVHRAFPPDPPPRLPSHR